MNAAARMESVTTLTAAQAAQQANRHLDGRYAEQQLVDAGPDLLCASPNVTGAPVVDGAVVWVNQVGASGWPGKVEQVDRRAGGLVTVRNLTSPRPVKFNLHLEDITVIDSPGDQVLADNTRSHADKLAARKAALEQELRAACDQYNHAHLAAALLQHAPTGAAQVTFTVADGQARPGEWYDDAGHWIGGVHDSVAVSVGWSDGSRPGEPGSWQHTFIPAGTVGQYIDLHLVRAWAIDNL